MRTEPVAESDHPLDLLAPVGERVDVHVRVGALEQAMLVPVGLADAEDIARGFEVGDVRALVGRVGNDEHDVDQRLGRKPRHRSRSDVLDANQLVAQGSADPCRFALVQARPLRFVLGQVDGRVVLDELPDGDVADLLVAQRCVVGGHADRLGVAYFFLRSGSLAKSSWRFWRRFLRCSHP
jgi:hypothetical protein